MKRFASVKQYTRIDDDAHDGHNDQSQQPQALSLSMSRGSPLVNEYEMQDRRVQVKSLASVFTEGFETGPTTRYSVLNDSHQSPSRKGIAAVLTGSRKVNTGYTPFFMRRWLLLCFALLWALIVLSLQILYSVSEARKGLATTDTSLRYLWTYGPTAFLVIVTILWRQVDYAVKYVQPWAVLAKGPSPAKQTLLLDYITAFQPVAFWRALRLRHMTVVSTILIFVLIKALTIISTGLMTLSVIQFDGVPQPMRLTTVFNGSEGLPADKIDSRAAVGLYGYNEYDMLLPNGTTNKYAFQSFEPSGSFPNDTYAYNTSVDVFTADGWDCETGNLTYVNGTDHEPAPDGTGLWENSPTMMYYNTTVKLPDCEIHNGHLDAPSWYWEQNDTTPRLGYWGIFQNVNCSNLDAKDPKKQRYMISVAYSKGTGQDDNIMLNSSNVVCRPSYAVQPGYVKIFANGTLDGDIVLSGTKRQLAGITADDIAVASYTTASQAAIPAKNDYNSMTVDDFMANMIRLTPNFELAMLMDNSWLAIKSQQAYQEYAAQLAGLYMMKPSQGVADVNGTVSRNELRLVVRSLPTRLMQACGAVMFITTLAMVLTAPRNVVPRSVESLASIAVILARSPDLCGLLRRTGHLGIDQLTQALAGHKYMSVVADSPNGRTFSIRVVTSSEITMPPETNTHIKWAQPLVLKRVTLLVTLLLAVSVLVSLEVLYQRSQADNGIANVNAESLQKYVWLYVPTVVLVLLATTFNVLDFELEFTDPYHELARGYTDASKSLLWDPLRDVTPKTCLQALRKSRFALVASSVSVCFAPLLTIAVSGLFTALTVPHTQNISTQVQTWFNVSSYDDSVSGDFPIPALILQQNMSYPQWTYDELAFPSIDLSSQATASVNQTDGTFVMNSPATRGAINCSIIPQDLILNLTYGPGTTICDNCINYNISSPAGCGNSGYEDWGFIWDAGAVTTPVSGTGYFGSLSYGRGEIVRTTDNATVLCPSFMIAYGKVTNANIDNWEAYYCNIGFETVQTKANISASQATIVSNPEVVSNSSKFMDWWRPDTGTGDAQLYFTPINFTHADEVFDVTVNVMVYGKDGVPRDELLNGDVLITQLTHTWRQWAAQWLNLYMRESISDLAKNTSQIAGGTSIDSLDGIYYADNQQRLFLNGVSTRILEGVIGLLLICGIVIFFLVDMSKVLPKPVGTIGAVASLLAGSRLVDEKSGLIPHGSEWLSDRELERRGLWASEKFRMGWWTDNAPGDSELDLSYQGGTGELYDDDPGKSRGEFKIDARPKIG